MIFWRTFINSLQLPKKTSLFSLNRTGMDITLIYLFILLLLASIPTFINKINAPEGIDTNIVFYMIYFFIFYYLPLVIMMILALALFAYIGTVIAKSLKRRLRFQIIWKMTVYVSTIPFIVYTIIAFFIKNIHFSFLVIALLFMYLLLLKMITTYPVLKPKKTHI